MKVIVLILSLLVFSSIGLGQTRTVKQQLAVNENADWSEFGENDDGGKVYLNASNVSKMATLAIFDVKMEINGVILYFTTAVNCVEGAYLSTNAFVQATPNGKLVRMPQYDMKRAQEIQGGVLKDMATYSCKYGKEIK